MTSRASDNKSGEEGDPRRYASNYHAPVLCDDVVKGLVTNRSGIYVDATLGGAGHSAALLDQLDSEGRVYGLDQDAEAIAEAESRLHEAIQADRFVSVRGNFSDMVALLEPFGVDQVDGLLMDLGVSSHQIDSAARGFSFQATGALDMRMDSRHGLTAYDLVNTWDAGALRRVIKAYGEEPHANRIVQRIVASRPLETTNSLAEVIRSTVPARLAAKTLARVFQAIRIAVNEELDVLEKALRASVDLVRPGGRIAVISYHSLEDRRVKRFLRYGNFEGQPVRDLYGQLISPWRLLTRKAIKPGDHEISVNPRARSARLRISERVHAATSGHVA